MVPTCTVKGLVTFGALESLLVGGLDDDWSQTLGVHRALGGASCCGHMHLHLHLSISLLLCSV